MRNIERVRNLEIQKEKMVFLNEDDKAVSLKELSDLFYAAKQMFDWIKEGGLSEEMKNTLFDLIESHTAHASKVLGYDSNAAREINERFADIRKANQTIHELEKKLANNTQVDGLTKLMTSMYYALGDWWKLQGFDHISEDSFGCYGFKAKFYVGTRNISFISRRPVTEENLRKSKLEQMVDEGYEFVLEDRDEYVLLDNENNRQKVMALFKSKFASADISSWENWCLRKSDKFQLRGFNAYIRDLSELKQLMTEMEKIKVDDDDD